MCDMIMLKYNQHLCSWSWSYNFGFVSITGSNKCRVASRTYVHCTETIKPFSAVCWLYAKYIYKERGVPMGLVETSWGGTNIEAWSSPDSLHACKLSDDEDQKYELYSDAFG